MVRAEDYRGSQSMNIKSSAGEYGPHDATLPGTTQSSSPTRLCLCPGGRYDVRGASRRGVEAICHVIEAPRSVRTVCEERVIYGQYTNQRHGYRLVAGGRPW